MKVRPSVKKICKGLGFKLDSDKFENCFLQMMEAVNLQSYNSLIEGSGNTELNLKKLKSILSKSRQLYLKLINSSVRLLA